MTTEAHRDAQPDAHPDAVAEVRTGHYVPVIDIAPFLAGDPQGKADVAAAMKDACENIGFLQIVGHGVDPELIDRVYRLSREFFDKPLADKTPVTAPSPDQVRGYSAVGAEGLSYSLDEVSAGDLKESFSIGPEADAGDPYFTAPEAGPHFAPNLWPEGEPEFRRAYEEYFDVMAKLSEDLMRIFAVALDLPEEFFTPKLDRHISMLRSLNYPDQPDAPQENQLRAGAHSDYGSLTILRQENAPGGLQVRDLQGVWRDIPAIEGALVVNIGDLMMQWTNDKWISTMHRVVNPPRDQANGSRRISLVFFHQPNYDALVETLESCIDPEHPSKYAPVTSGDHLYSKFVKQSTFGAGV
jgi:isopenicillin N synthase-like dioxygenase